MHKQHPWRMVIDNEAASLSSLGVQKPKWQESGKDYCVCVQVMWKELAVKLSSLK